MSTAVPARPRIVRCWLWAPAFLAIALASLLVVGGAASALAQDASEGAIRLTLAEAVEMAFDYDLEHAIARLQWENAQIDSRIAQASGPVSAYDRLRQEMQERRAENDYLSARRSLVINVTQDYLNLKQALRQLEIARRQLELARQQLAIVQEMVRIGERHPQEALREENRVAGLELSLAAAERNVENRRQSLLARLGLPLDAQVELVDEPEAVPWTWTLEETLAYAEEHAFTVWERQANLRLAAMDLEALRVQDPAPLQLAKAENEYRIAEMQAQQAQRSFQNSVRAAYHGLVDAARRLETSCVDYELAVAAHETARRRHQAGLTTDLDWAQAELDLLSAEQSRHDALYNYVLSRMELLRLIGHPLDMGEDPAE